MNAVWDAAALVLVLIGALLCLTAAIGVARFSDVPTRLHAATKPQVLGVVVIAIGVALSARAWPVAAFLVVVVLLQLATAPLAAHMLGRQAYRNGTVDRRAMVADELAGKPADPGRSAGGPDPFDPSAGGPDVPGPGGAGPDVSGPDPDPDVPGPGPASRL